MLYEKMGRTSEVYENRRSKQYYDILIRHEKELRLKRYFDILLSMILLVILSPIMLVISIAIKLDSPGPVIYKQVRVTQYGKKFHILKFRTMVQNADKMGTQVTISQDSRLTRVGKVIRGCRIDEFPQLIKCSSRRDEFCWNQTGSCEVCKRIYERNVCDSFVTGRNHFQSQRMLQR